MEIEERDEVKVFCSQKLKITSWQGERAKKVKYIYYISCPFFNSRQLLEKKNWCFFFYILHLSFGEWGSQICFSYSENGGQNQSFMQFSCNSNAQIDLTNKDFWILWGSIDPHSLNVAPPLLQSTVCTFIRRLKLNLWFFKNWEDQVS
jgi:hypothetical protein